MKEGIRINKYLRDKGIASRREADDMVAQGRVLINGAKAEMGSMVDPDDEVVVAGTGKKLVYLAYNKPRRLATQSTDKEADTVIARFEKEGLFPVGRLDKDSEGLLILTNDGRLTTKLLGEGTKVEKEYVVETREKIRAGIPAILERGMDTRAFGPLKPAKAKILGDHTISIALIEGKKHQIRVMLSELNLTTVGLKRIRIGRLRLGTLKPGQTKPIVPEAI